MVRADTPLRINRVIVEGQSDGREGGGEEGEEGHECLKTPTRTHILTPSTSAPPNYARRQQAYGPVGD